MRGKRDDRAVCGCVRKADLIASWFAVCVGLISICFGAFTKAGFWTIIAMLLIYLVGSIGFFLKGLSSEEVANLENVEITYGKQYWFPLIGGLFASILIAVIYFTQIQSRISSAILVGLGSMAALTAFISPKYNEKTRLDNADEFG